jgi:hypothetical protein
MKFLLLSVFGLLLFAAACSSVKIRYDFDKEANFASLQTYHWIAKPDTENIAPAKKRRRNFLDQEIKKAADNQLAAKGYRLDAADPDFLVISHIDVKDKLNLTDWGYSYSGNWSYWGWGGQDVDVQQYREGVLIIDVVNAASKELIWRGVAQKTLPEEMPSPEEVGKNINKIVIKILKEFPPQTAE